MKKILIVIAIILGLFLLFGCESQGTLRESQATSNQPCVIGGDTVDLYVYWPSSMRSIYIAKVRNSSKTVTSLTYTEGKADNSIIIVDKDKSTSKVVTGSILSENDSIIVIKKK